MGGHDKKKKKKKAGGTTTSPTKTTSAAADAAKAPSQADSGAEDPVTLPGVEEENTLAVDAPLAITADASEMRIESVEQPSIDDIDPMSSFPEIPESIEQDAADAAQPASDESAHLVCVCSDSSVPEGLEEPMQGVVVSHPASEPEAETTALHAPEEDVQGAFGASASMATETEEQPPMAELPVFLSESGRSTGEQRRETDTPPGSVSADVHGAEERFTRIVTERDELSRRLKEMRRELQALQSPVAAPRPPPPDADGAANSAVSGGAVSGGAVSDAASPPAATAASPPVRGHAMPAAVSCSAGLSSETPEELREALDRAAAAEEARLAAERAREGAERARAALERELGEVRGALEELRAEYDSFREGASAVCAEAVGKGEEVAQLQQQLIRTASEARQAEARAVQLRLEKAEHALERERGLAARLEREVGRERATSEGLRAQLEAFSSRSEMDRTELSAVRQELNRLREAHSLLECDLELLRSGAPVGLLLEGDAGCTSSPEDGSARGDGGFADRATIRTEAAAEVALRFRCLEERVSIAEARAAAAESVVSKMIDQEDSLTEALNSRTAELEVVTREALWRAHEMERLEQSLEQSFEQSLEQSFEQRGEALPHAQWEEQAGQGRGSGGRGDGDGFGEAHLGYPYPGHPGGAYGPAAEQDQQGPEQEREFLYQRHLQELEEAEERRRMEFLYQEYTQEPRPWDGALSLHHHEQQQQQHLRLSAGGASGEGAEEAAAASEAAATLRRSVGSAGRGRLSATELAAEEGRDEGEIVEFPVRFLERPPADTAADRAGSATAGPPLGNGGGADAGEAGEENREMARGNAAAACADGESSGRAEAEAQSGPGGPPLQLLPPPLLPLPQGHQPWESANPAARTPPASPAPNGGRGGYGDLTAQGLQSPGFEDLQSGEGGRSPGEGGWAAGAAAGGHDPFPVKRNRSAGPQPPLHAFPGFEPYLPHPTHHHYSGGHGGGQWGEAEAYHPGGAYPMPHPGEQSGAYPPRGAEWQGGAAEGYGQGCPPYEGADGGGGGGYPAGAGGSAPWVGSGGSGRGGYTATASAGVASNGHGGSSSGAGSLAAEEQALLRRNSEALLAQQRYYAQQVQHHHLQHHHLQHHQQQQQQHYEQQERPRRRGLVGSLWAHIAGYDHAPPNPRALR